MPTLIFGLDAGQVGVAHEDTWLRSDDTDENWGGNDVYNLRGDMPAITRWGLTKFDLTLLPANIIPSSAILTYTSERLNEICNVDLYELTTAYVNGAGNPWEPPAGANEGCTWSHAAFVAGTRWAGGGDISAADINNIVDSLAFPAAGVTANFDVLTNINAYLAGTAPNMIGNIIQYRLSLNAPAGAGVNQFWSFGAIAGLKPYLTIVYTVPSGIIRRQSKIAIGISPSIGF